jgi:hypothetical protein
MAEVPNELKLANWQSAKKKAHADKNFKKGATGIDKQLKTVEKLLSASEYKKLLPLLVKFRTTVRKALLDSTKLQKNAGKNADPKSYEKYNKYLDDMMEKIDSLLKTIKSVYEIDTTSKRKRQPKDLTLALILKNKKLLEIFRAYCQFMKSPNEIEYVKDVMVRKNKPSKKLYDRYFAENSNFQINITPTLREPWHQANASGSWKRVDVKPTVLICMELIRNNNLKNLKDGVGKSEEWLNRICDA